MTQQHRTLASGHCVLFASLAFLAFAEAAAPDLDEDFRQLVAPSVDGSFVASPDEVAPLLRQAIAAKDAKFLIGLLWTQERHVGRQALRAIMRLPTQEKYEFLGLMVAEDSFWRNVSLERDDAGKIQGLQQEVVAEGVKHMIQQEVSIQDFYDLNRRRELQRIVADVVKNGLPNRDPNWKPKPFVDDPPPKKTRVIDDPFRNAPTGAQETSGPTNGAPATQPARGGEEEQRRDSFGVSCVTAVLLAAVACLGVAAARVLRRRRAKSSGPEP
jgi:hypothetical protein